MSFLIRCSSLGKIMTESRTKGELSETAKSHVLELLAQDLFDAPFEFSSKETEKGTEVEPESIGLLNRVRGLTLVKNTERRTVGGLTGEPDLIGHDRGHDVKSPWSVKTFPFIAELARKSSAFKTYEWQMRGYMALWDIDRWEVNYCLVDTPARLVGFEPLAVHCVSHIPEHQRLTTIVIERDKAMESAIFSRIKEVQSYYDWALNEFSTTHKENSHE